MRTVDEIVRDHDAGITAQGAESRFEGRRFSRRRHIETVRGLSDVNGWRTSGYLALHWGLIIASLWIAGATMHWAAFVVGAFVIASRLQALGVMLHDGTHYLLYKNRTVNDVFCDLFVAFPLGMSTTLYRKTHFRHHRYTNTDDDQDMAAQREEVEWYVWPKTRWECAITILRSVSGVNTHRAWILYKHWAPWNHLRDPISDDFPMRARVLYIGSTVAIYAFFAWAISAAPLVTLSLIAMYFVAGFMILNLINRIRVAAEHLGVAGTHELNSTRTVLPSRWERFFIAPYGVNYHLEHHLFPSVPGCNLGRLHRALMADPEFAQHAHLTKTYLGLFRELMRPNAADRQNRATTIEATMTQATAATEADGNHHGGA